MTFGKSCCRYLFVGWNCTITMYSFLGLLSKLKLATGGICCLWCGGWAYSGIGAFAFSCPLSVHCVFCTVAQLLGLVFPSLPVFASGGWGSECGIATASRWSIPVDLDVPQPASRQWSVGCVWWSLRKVWESSYIFFFLVCVWAYFYFGLTNPHASRWFLS